MDKEGEEKINYKEEGISTKNRMTAMVLCLLLGFFGVHRLYAGKIGTGFLMAYCSFVTVLALIACLPIGLMCFITLAAVVVNDFVVLAFGQFYDCYGKFISSNEIQ